jgi:hypothetical protein
VVNFALQTLLIPTAVARTAITEPSLVIKIVGMIVGNFIAYTFTAQVLGLPALI